MAIDTSGYIYRRNLSPETKVAVSSRVRIYSYAARENQFVQIGVVSNFAPSQNRNAEPVRGIGYGDQIAELVPTVQDPISITVERAALYLANMFQVFGYFGGTDGLVRALKHQRWPFDLRQEMVMSEVESRNNLAANTRQAKLKNPPGEVAGAIKALITLYEGCWMTSYDFTLGSDTSIISESTTIMVTDIVDGVNSYEEFTRTGLDKEGTGLARQFRDARNSPLVAPQGVINENL